METSKTKQTEIDRIFARIRQVEQDKSKRKRILIAIRLIVISKRAQARINEI